MFDELLPRDPLFARDRNRLLAELISSLIAGRSLSLSSASHEFDKIKGRFYTGKAPSLRDRENVYVLSAMSPLHGQSFASSGHCSLFIKRKTIRKPTYDDPIV